MVHQKLLKNYNLNLSSLFRYLCLTLAIKQLYGFDFSIIPAAYWICSCVSQHSEHTKDHDEDQVHSIPSTDLETAKRTISKSLYHISVLVSKDNYMHKTWRLPVQLSCLIKWTKTWPWLEYSYWHVDEVQFGIENRGSNYMNIIQSMQWPYPCRAALSDSLRSILVLWNKKRTSHDLGAARLNQYNMMWTLVVQATIRC